MPVITKVNHRTIHCSLRESLIACTSKDTKPFTLARGWSGSVSSTAAPRALSVKLAAVAAEGEALVTMGT
jgi:hypothetical protein